jgi:hypothetical protein
VEDLFLTERHPTSRRYGTIEDDGVSAWLYLSEVDTPHIIADAWVFNRIPAPPESLVESYKPNPPPAAQGYAADDALCTDPCAYRWELLWSEDGESLAALRDGVAVAMIIRAAKPGYSRFLIKSGFWGEPWNTHLFSEVMNSLA